MKPMHIAMALLSAAMFFVLAGVFMGVQLELDGTKLVVDTRSEEHTSELQSPTHISYAVFCLKKKFF